MGEVKADRFVIDELTGLFDMSAEHLAQSRLQKVSRGVIAAGCHSGFSVVCNFNCITDRNLT